MASSSALRSNLQRIDGKGYKAYKDIQGEYSFNEFSVFVDYVQGDPFAGPSRVRIRVPQRKAGFPGELFRNRSREKALRDYLVRAFAASAKRFTKGNRGIGKSGMIGIDPPGQEILERTAVLINEEFVEARFVMGLPAFGRKIAGRHAEAMFFDELPQIATSSLFYQSMQKEKLTSHVETSEDADALREQLTEHNCVAFIADDSVLPRRSGVDPRPLTGDNVVPFRSADEFRIEMSTPNRGSVGGMGIPRGVNLIVGGGYHGKSTLLSALEMGIYNHVPGDGREFVVSDPATVKIRAEDGRRVEKVGITPFIDNLPFNKDTTRFCTEDASGSTSQAANIVEALEVDTGSLLIDEDTSATNFMIRDQRMQELVAKEHEPITPFIDKVRQLSDDWGVSTVLVIGGSGDYFDVADRVICMHDYLPQDVTEEAKQISRKHAAERRNEGGENFGEIRHRLADPASFDPSKGKKPVKIAERGLKAISFGDHHIDLSAVEQLTDPSQTRAIGEAMYFVKQLLNEKQYTLKEAVDEIMRRIEEEGLGSLSQRPVGDYAEFRKFELAAAINRLRTLQVSQRE